MDYYTGTSRGARRRLEAGPLLTREPNLTHPDDQAIEPPAPESPQRSVRVRSASWIFGSQVLGLLVSFPMSIMLARALGPAGKGTLSVVQLVAGFSAIVLNLGIGQALMYFAARREVRGRDATYLSYAYGVGVTAAACLVAIPMRETIADLLNLQASVYVVIGVVAIAPVLISQFLNAYVVGTGAIRNASLVSVGSIAFQLVGSLVLWFFGALSPESAVLVWFTAIIGVSAVLTVMTWAGEAAEGTTLGVRSLVRRMRGYAIHAWPAGILGTAAQRIDVFLLTSLKGPAEVGIYSVAVTLAELCGFAPNALNSVLLPKVAAEQEAGHQVTLRLSRIAWMLTLGTGIVVFAVSVPLVPILFGRAFAASVLPLALILPGIVAMAAAGQASAYLAGTGHPLDVTNATAVNVVLNVAVNLVLIPRWGAAGAALSSSLSYCAYAVVIVGYFWHRSGTNPVELLVPRRGDFAELYSAVRRALRREG